MLITPGKHDLEQRVEVCKGHRTPDQDTAPDERADVPEDDPQLVNLEFRWLIHRVSVVQSVVPFTISPGI